MNNHSGVNESDLDNFSPDLDALSELDKELNFPFDHLYACHSQNSDCGQSLTLDKNVEISTHCLMQPQKTIQEKDAEILTLKNQNKKLKELLIYHLDLIQQQNDVITNREKSSNTTGQEYVGTAQGNVARRGGKHLTLAQRHLKPPPLFRETTPTCTITSAIPSPVECPVETTEPALFSSFNEILGTEGTLYGTDGPKPFGHDPFDLGTPSEALPELPEFLPTDMPLFMDNPLAPLTPDFDMLERLTPAKKEVKPPEPAPRELSYTITTNSGMPIIQKIKNRKRTSCIGSLSRMPKTPKPEPSTIYDNEIYNAQKKAKIMSAYSKSKVNSLRYPYAGSLSDRLQLIDTTPTGEDPYQIGEAEMREQSPIPRLVLPKKNRVRIHTGEGFGIGLPTSPPTSTKSTRRIYDPEPDPKPKKSKKPPKAKTNRRKAPAQGSTITKAPSVASTSAKSSTATEPNRKQKKEETNWDSFYKNTKPTLEEISLEQTKANLSSTLTSLGELVTSGNHLPSATLMTSSSINLFSPYNLEKMDISTMSFNEIFQPEPPGSEDVDVVEVTPEPEFMQATDVLKTAAEVLKAAECLKTDEGLKTAESLKATAEPNTKKRGSRTTSLAGSSTAGEDASGDIHRGTESKRGGRKRALSSASATKREKPPPKPRASRGRGGYRGKRGSWIAVPPLTTRKPYHTAVGHPDISWYLGHDPDVKKEDVEQLAENTSSNVEVPRWREMIFTSLDSAVGTENTDDEVYRKRHQKLEAEERRQLSNFMLPWVKTSKAQKRSKRSKTLH